MSTPAASTPTGHRGRIFITGASGYIGSEITKQAVAQGYTVHGLSRSDKNDAMLASLGAVPVRGDLGTLDVLSREAAAADVVMHLADAYAGNYGKDYAPFLAINVAAGRALAEPLKGTEKILVTTSGTLAAEADPDGGETTEESPVDPHPVIARHASIIDVMSFNEKGSKVCNIRLAPWVYGRAGSGVRLFSQMFMAGGEVLRVGSGAAKTSVVHVDDAAALYLLAAQKAKGGDVFNATSSTDVTFAQLAEGMSGLLGLPLREISYEEAGGKFGRFFAMFLSSPNRASSVKARKELGWEPKEIGILEDIKTGSYPAIVAELRKGAVVR